MSPTPEDILEIVRVQLGRSRVEPSDHLMGDLGADSADVLNVVVALEDYLGVSIGEEALARLETVEDVLELASGRL